MNYFYDRAYKITFLLDELLKSEKVKKVKINIQKKIIDDLMASEFDPLLKTPEFDFEKDKIENYTRKIFRKRGPIIFRGLAKEWECCKKWDFDFFKKEYGDKKVWIEKVKGITHNERAFEITLSDYIDNYLGDPKTYLTVCPLIAENKELLLDLDKEVMDKLKGKSSFGNMYHMFFGGPSHGSPIHSAMSRAVFIMVKGSKKWRVWPKEAFSLLNVEINDCLHSYSDLDLDNPNLNDFPWIEKIPRYEFVLHEGDVLLNDPWIFHSASNLDNSIGLRCGFPDLYGILKNSKTQTLTKVLKGHDELLNTFKGFLGSDNYK